MVASVIVSLSLLSAFASRHWPVRFTRSVSLQFERCANLLGDVTDGMRSPWILLLTWSGDGVGRDDTLLH